MGRFVNSGNSAFQVALNSEIYVDKTGLLAYTNKVMDTTAKFICNSRPRRFGKSITADLKWNQNAQTAIRQIKNRQHPETIANYTDNILLVGISYDKKQKTHNCVIEKYSEK